MTAGSVRANIHGTLIVLDEHGLLVTGESGSGKTTLALALIDRWAMAGRFARLVADDQILIEASGGRLIGHTPAPIAGLVEVRGWGIAQTRSVSTAIVDLIVELEDRSAIERMPEPRQLTPAGVTLPAIVAPARDVIAAVAIIMAALGAQADRRSA